jgi:Na+/melibiose symporter-like transporter
MKALYKNKPLVLVFIFGCFLGIATTNKLASLVYLAKYNLHNEGIFTLLIAAMLTAFHYIPNQIQSLQTQNGF